ncbi:MAG TPA: ABC transporter permease [Gemmatimonadaceae bacterium]|nr:ABC transporter permease [Gemmatimonadaceae bacterium]
MIPIVQVRVGLRRVWHRPVFSLIAVAVLGCGTGAATAVFQALDHLLLAPPVGVADPGHLATLELDSQGMETPQRDFSLLQVQGIASLSPQVQSAAFIEPDTVSVRVVGPSATADSVEARAAFVGSRYFATAGIAMAEGRGIGLAAGGMLDVGREVVLGYTLWQHMDETEPLRLGALLRIRGRVFTLVGIAAPGVTGADREVANLWLPLGAAALDGRSSAQYDLHIGYPFRVLVRVPSGAAAAGARIGIARVLLGTPEHESPRTNAGSARIRFVSVATPEWATDGIHLPLAIMLATVCGAILLIGVANVAILLLARATRAAESVRIQRALGATRGRLLAQHLFENAQVAVAGGIVAAVVSAAFSGIAYRLLSEQGTSFTPTQDWRAVAITMVGVAASGAGAMVLPALYTWRVTGEGTGGAPSTRWSTKTPGWQYALIGIQVALSFSLLVTSGLFAKSFRSTLSARIGISLPGLLYAAVPDATSAVRSPVAQAPLSFEHSISDDLLQLPVVRQVALASTLPLDHFEMIVVNVPELLRAGRRTITALYVTAVTPSYFAAMGSTLLRGRVFTNADGAHAPPVTVLDQTMARAIWPNENPLGKCLQVGPPPFQCFTVVGVVADPPGLGLRRAPAMQYFLPAAQRPDLLDRGAYVFIRVSGNVETGVREVRSRLVATGMMGAHPVVQPLRALAARDIQPLYTAWVVLGIVSIVGLLLAGAGIYAICLYFVRARARELGIRMALGAPARSIVWVVLRSTVATAIAGAACGALLVVSLARYLAPLLFHVSPYDAATYSAATLILGLGAAASVLVPARLATHIDLRDVLVREDA